MIGHHKFEYISWNRFYRLATLLHGRIRASGFEPEVIIGIARGGYMPARVLADLFGVMDLAAVKIEHYHGPRKSRRAIVRHPLAADISGKRVLVVDDVSDSGETFGALFEHLATVGIPAELRTAVLHHKLTSSCTPDYHATRVLKWRWISYPWALTEDLRVLLESFSPRPESIEEASRALHSRHGLVVPRSVMSLLADALDFHSTVAKPQ